MNDLRTAAQQALEALWFANAQHWFGSQTIERAISSLQAALAQQEQEPCKRHNPCERLPDGYCARCHSEMYP